MTLIAIGLALIELVQSRGIARFWRLTPVLNTGWQFRELQFCDRGQGGDDDDNDEDGGGGEFYSRRRYYLKYAAPSSTRRRMFSFCIGAFRRESAYRLTSLRGISAVTLSNFKRSSRPRFSKCSKSISFSAAFRQNRAHSTRGGKVYREKLSSPLLSSLSSPPLPFFLS